MRKRWASEEEPTTEPQIALLRGDMPHIMLGGSTETVRHRNHLYFYDEVTEDSAMQFITNLREATLDMRRAALSLEVDPPALHVHINSHGGSLLAGFAMYEAVRECPLDVHTHIEGAAASAATLLSVAGDHRTIGQHSFFLVHQLSTWFAGTFEELKDQMESNTLMMDHIKGIYADRAKFSAEELDDLLKRDLWLDAAAALKYGMVDEIRGQ